MATSQDVESFGARMTIAEDRITRVEEVLKQHKDTVDRLLDVTYQNGRDLARMNGRLLTEVEKVAHMVTAHAAQEARERQRATTYTMWTLITLLASVGGVAATIFWN